MRTIVVAAAVALAASGISACQPPRVFKNCAEVRTVYPGGIARPGYVQIGPPLKKAPHVDKALYDANPARDADKDGIGCEVT
ncbi:MAG TPA: excalibur calcium-binding domain-containing protein [Iamia sp.]|nr:excalibur calcium-binding domain-containing protein [Iamia sp.]